MAEPSSKRARTDAPVENPYLAHLSNPADRMTGGANGAKGGFEGWIPRKQGGKDVEAVMVRPFALERFQSFSVSPSCGGEGAGLMSIKEAVVASLALRGPRRRNCWAAAVIASSARLHAWCSSLCSRASLSGLRPDDFASPSSRTDGYSFTTVQAGDFNPFNQRPFSKRYREIFEVRKKLPVHQQMDEFLKMFNANQFVVLSGETGSGKTTQCVTSRKIEAEGEATLTFLWPAKDPAIRCLRRPAPSSQARHAGRVHSASTSRCNECRQARCGRDGRFVGRGGRLQHPFRGLHEPEHLPEVRRARSSVVGRRARC